MKTHHTLANYRSVLTLIYFSVLSSALLLTAGTAFAQEGSSSPARTAVMGVMLLVFLVICVAFYVYIALALQTIAKKTNTENGWLAWIPVANIFLMLNIAKKPLWWFILCLIPLVNIVIIIIVWMAIAEARGKPSWWGILMIVPVVNLIVPGYLAWAD
ncbi:MAG: DUF5684 domain-containing protein [Terriglobia bacterium]|jgi:magnesium-transporting ATPase (P-type)